MSNILETDGYLNLNGMLHKNVPEVFKSAVVSTFSKTSPTSAVF
jgi:hypothetical protein